MTPQAALAALMRSPESFLRTRVLSINGGATSGVTEYVMGSTGHNATTGFEKYRLGVGLAAGATETHKFQAHNLRMIPATEEVDYTRIPGYPATHAVPIVLTGQLSGCCLCYASTGAGLMLAHIQPQPQGGRGDGVKMQNDIDATGAFGGVNAALETWGAKDYGQGGKASVVAVYSKGAWQLFGQVQDGNATAVARLDKLL
jgi:hypothetical protein